MVKSRLFATHFTCPCHKAVKCHYSIALGEVHQNNGTCTPSHNHQTSFTRKKEKAGYFNVVSGTTNRWRRYYYALWTGGSAADSELLQRDYQHTPNLRCSNQLLAAIIKLN
eukprot:scpid107821/ scgid29823/ 